jgi:uncharacterized protein YchJ
MCSFCTQSSGKLLIQSALTIMVIKHGIEFTPPKLIKLRYDKYIVYDFDTILIEYHGIQHEKENSFFHNNNNTFNNCRQRDLIKRKLVDLCLGKYRYISFNNKWGKKSVNDVIERLSKFIKSKDMYDIDNENKWLFDEPNMNTIEKYYKFINI